MGRRGPDFAASIRPTRTSEEWTFHHYDRWWNPATERQATDRVHRIGQAKTVWVYLPIAKDTAEERLDELLRRKQVVADSVIEGLRDLSLDDLAGLLAP